MLVDAESRDSSGIRTGMDPALVSSCVERCRLPHDEAYRRMHTTGFTSNDTDDLLVMRK
jgi:hypothetical protein